MEGPSWKDQVEEEDRPVVEELKKRMAEQKLEFGKMELRHDVHLARFARARKHDVEAAWDMLKNNLEWRRTSRVDTILQWFPETPEGKDIISYWPNAEYGNNALCGRPVICEHMVLLDAVDVMERFTPETLINFHLWVMERDLQRCYDASCALGKPITQTIVVQNLSGLGWRHVHPPAVEVVKKMLQLDQLNYPEMMGGLVAFNAPAIFPLAFRLVRPFIDPVTLAKLQVIGVGEHRASWLRDPQVAQMLSVENVPPEWGGKSPQKWSKWPNGIEIDSEYGAVEEEAEDGQKKEKLLVDARGKVVYEFHVEKDGSAVGWQFTTESYDISFGVVSHVDKKKKSKSKKDDDDADVVELVPPSRVDSHIEPCTGMLHDLSKGKHSFVFDNTYSWTTSKTVHLVFNVREPLTKQQRNALRRKRQKEKKKAKSKKPACASCGYVFKAANASMCPECGCKDKK